MELTQKIEIFHCYNGSGGSSRGADGVDGENTWAFLRKKQVFVTKSVGNRLHELTYSRKSPPRPPEFENRGFSQEFQEETKENPCFSSFFPLVGSDS